MKTQIVSIALLFTFYNLCFLHVNSQDSCNTNLNLDGKFNFNTSSHICNPVWRSQDYILRYKQVGPNLWSFVLSTPVKNAYVAIGFSPNGKMVGSSAVVGWIASDGTPSVKQYLLSGTTPSQVKVDQGNLYIVANSSSIISLSSRIYMGFQLNTKNPGNRLIFAVGPSGVFPGSNNRLENHDDAISTTLNYATGITTGKSETETSTKTHSTVLHGTISIIGWGILMPIGAIVARYCKKWNPQWYNAHISIQSIAFVFGVISIVSGLILEDKIEGVDVDTHKGLGIFMLVLACLQVAAFLARPTKDSKYRKYWNWYHWTVGRVVILLAVGNIFYGIHLSKVSRTTWNISYATILLVISILTVILEIKFCMSRR